MASLLELIPTWQPRQTDDSISYIDHDDHRSDSLFQLPAANQPAGALPIHERNCILVICAAYSLHVTVVSKSFTDTGFSVFESKLESKARLKILRNGGHSGSTSTR